MGGGSVEDQDADCGPTVRRDLAQRLPGSSEEVDLAVNERAFYGQRLGLLAEILIKACPEGSVVTLAGKLTAVGGEL